MLESQRKKTDAVTVGQIRGRHLERLEREISELSTLIRKGYHSRAQAEKFLQETIGKTLTLLDNIDGLASVVVLFPDEVCKPAQPQGGRP